MKIVEPKDKAKWDDFLLRNEGHLLQSWYWGEFQKSLGRKVFRLAVEDNNEMLVAAQIIKHNLLLGKSYSYCPRGPLPSVDLKSQILKLKTLLKSLFGEIMRIAKKENVIFFRADPEVGSESNFAKVLREVGFEQAEKQVQPKDTLVLDIAKSEEDLLAQMHHKTRYNIRLAGRKGVVIKQSRKVEDVKEFCRLLEETTRRDEFRPHPREYYLKQIEILGEQNLVKLFAAEYKGKKIASIIVSFFASTAIYLHGAFDFKHRNLMAPHLLQWEAIKEAKRRGCRYHDFWGIAPTSSEENHPWTGITRFKRGFGGKEKNFVGALDLIYQPWWYKIYNFFSKTK
jgi:lipid II:glycine glycyltransferase (peptidoglycan interpeptide bridge formation enzyme)